MTPKQQHFKMCTCDHYRHIKGMTVCEFDPENFFFFTKENFGKKCKTCPNYENLSDKIMGRKR